MQYFKKKKHSFDLLFLLSLLLKRVLSQNLISNFQLVKM